MIAIRKPKGLQTQKIAMSAGKNRMIQCCLIANMKTDSFSFICFEKCVRFSLNLKKKCSSVTSNKYFYKLPLLLR